MNTEKELIDALRIIERVLRVKFTQPHSEKEIHTVLKATRKIGNRCTEFNLLFERDYSKQQAFIFTPTLTVLAKDLKSVTEACHEVERIFWGMKQISPYIENKCWSLSAITRILPEKENKIPKEPIWRKEDVCEIS